MDARPETLATWDNLENAAKRLVRKEGSGAITRSGFVNENSTMSFISYVYTNGGTFYNDDFTEVAFNNSRGIEALEFMYRVLHEFDVVRPGASTNDMINGAASIIFRNTSSIPTFEQQAPGYTDWLNMVPVPQGPQGTGMGGASWSNMFVIPAGAEKPDLAWRFIQLWLSPRVSVERFLHWGGKNVNSARLDVLQSDAFIDAIKRYRHMENAPIIFNTGGPYPNVHYTELSRAIGPLLAEVYRDARSAAPTALAEAERIGNSILRK